MKQIILNIPDDYSDVLSVTVVGVHANITNVYTMAYNISDVIYKAEIDIKAGEKNDTNV